MTGIWESFRQFVTATVLVGFLQWLIARRSEEKKAASLVFLFAVESTKLFERFAQYLEQVFVERRVSMSRPFQLLPDSEMSRLIEMDVDRTILNAVFHVRELNSLVTLQVDHAHAMIGQPMYTTTVEGKVLKILPAQKEFDRIKDFVAGAKNNVLEGIEALLKDAEKRCGMKTVAALRVQFEADKKKMESAEARRAKDGHYVGEREDLPI